jgi:hypothetical protein
MPATCELNREEIIRRYQAGERMGVLGREAGVPWQQVWSILNAAGVIRWANGSDPRRTNGQPRAATTATRTVRTAARQSILERLTYGIEIECTLPTGTALTGLPTGWAGKGDGSIRPAEGFYGVEIVSPILRGSEGARQIMEVCRWLSEKNARVNATTGFHVHVGWTTNGPALGRLLKLVGKNEKGLFAVTGTKSREQGRWCQPIAFNASYAAIAVQSGANLPHYIRSRSNRYQSLNLTNLRRGGKHTVEFRLFGGTVNPIKILTYVRIALGLVEKAMRTETESEWGFGQNGTADRHRNAAKTPPSN